MQSCSYKSRPQFTLSDYILGQGLCHFHQLFLSVFSRWKTVAEGVPHVSGFNTVMDLPSEISWTEKREDEMTWSESAKEIQRYTVPNTMQCNIFSFFVFCGIELILKGMLGSTKKIQSLEDMKKTIPSQSTKLTGRNIYLPASMSSTIRPQLCVLRHVDMVQTAC